MKRIHVTKNKRTFIVSLATLVIIVVFIATSFYLLRNIGVAMRINGIAVSNEVYNAEYAKNIRYLEGAKQTVDTEAVQRNTTDYLIEKSIIEQEAALKDISVTDEELASYYANRVDNYPSEEALLKYLSDTYGISKDEYLATLSYDLLKEKIQAQLQGKPLAEFVSEQKSQATIKIYLD